MGRSPPRSLDPEGYSGPTLQELGTLAKWVNEAGSSLLDEAPAAARRPVAVAPASRLRDMDPENYSGPTRQELGALVEWGNERTESRPDDPPVARPTSESLRAIEAELWISELRGLAELSEPGSRVRRARSTKTLVPDPVLRQIDEIEASLRKRVS